MRGRGGERRARRAAGELYNMNAAVQFRQAIINSDCSPASQRDPPADS